MAEVNMRKAQAAYDALIKMLDTRDWKYDKYEDKLMVKGTIKGEDLPVNFIVIVKPKNEVVQVLSMMPFYISEDKRVDAAIAVNVANYGLVEGSFDYDLSDGEIRFRMTATYRDEIPSADVMERMIFLSAFTADRYNDKFFMISKGMMTVQQFIEQENA